MDSRQEVLKMSLKQGIMLSYVQIQEDNMKKIRIALAAVLAAVLLFGCAGKGTASAFSPEQSSIFVSREGRFLSAAVEAYDSKDYYSEETLRAFAQASIDEYNQNAGRPDAVTLESCTMKNGKASLILEYASGDDLVQFAGDYQSPAEAAEDYKDGVNQVTALHVASVADLASDGEFAQAAFLNSKNQNPAAYETVTKNGDAHVVMVEGESIIQTEGKILFITQGTSMVSNTTAQTPEGRSYIVFK